MSSFAAIYWREIILLRHRLGRQLAAAAVTPLLYLLTFGYALGGHLKVGDHSYMEFLLPGLIAMAGLTQAFSIASEVNITRFYTGIFEEIQASPTHPLAYVLAEVASGLTRVFLAVAVISLTGWLGGFTLAMGGFFWLAVFLNGFTFSALALALALRVRSHADQGILNSFVITPMAFLGGTFFPVESLPDWLGYPLRLLPLTQASRAIRAACLGEAPSLTPFIALSLTSVIFLLLALQAVGKARD
ncbi:MAG: ABC transporter permease [Planctomycetota bacterium]|jgi:ABC-type multidrug transport system permease subunit|nr:ABC transporter permease [Planctomycetota bacterium]